jgi:hypothetical protein
MKRMSGSIERCRASSKKRISCTTVKKFLNTRWLRSMILAPTSSAISRVEKSHLAAGVTNVGNPCNARQIFGQLRAFVGQIECCHRSIIDDVELSEQPRNQSLSDSTTWGANDVERGGLVSHTMVRLATSRLRRVDSRPIVSRELLLSAYSDRSRGTVMQAKVAASDAKMAGEPLRLRNLDDWPRSAHRRPRRFCCFHNVGEANTIILGPDCLEPMPHIAPEHE